MAEDLDEQSTVEPSSTIPCPCADRIHPSSPHKLNLPPYSYPTAISVQFQSNSYLIISSTVNPERRLITSFAAPLPITSFQARLVEETRSERAYRTFSSCLLQSQPRRCSTPVRQHPPPFLTASNCSFRHSPRSRATTTSLRSTGNAETSSKWCYEKDHNPACLCRM